MIWSDSLDCMVVDEFIYKGAIWQWNDADCVYYNAEDSEQYIFDVPDYL